jgi:hypothetical protein
MGMRALSNADFLSLWEAGHRLHSLDRGLLAVRMLLAKPGEDSVADWPLGRRNEALARLHANYFGPALQGWTECAQCGEKLEFTVDCGTLIERQKVRGRWPIVMKGQTFRVPTSRDLARVAGEADAGAAAVRLAELCRIHGSADGDAGWSHEEMEELGQQMSDADPLAEILLSFACPECEAMREQALDLPAFLWAELEVFAKRMLREIHILASSYGWSEAEILALSESRRAMYVQMVQA